MEELTLEEVEVFRVCAQTETVYAECSKGAKVSELTFLLLLTVQSPSQDDEDILKKSKKKNLHPHLDSSTAAAPSPPHVCSSSNSCTCHPMRA